MGQPKAWLPFHGEVLLARVVRVVTGVLDPVIVVAAPGQDLPPLPRHVEIVRDSVEGEGPMRGLLTGLEALGGRRDAAFLCSCDLPLLEPGFVARVSASLGDHDVCVPHVEGRLHPTAAAYRKSVGEVARSLLAEGNRRMTALIEACRSRMLGEEELTDVDPGLCSLRNINTPEDYEHALRMFKAD